MIRALLHYLERFVESTGGWSILALDGVLLIPLVFAAFFFFPMVALTVVGVAFVLTIGTLGVMHAVHTYHHRHGVM